MVAKRKSPVKRSTTSSTKRKTPVRRKAAPKAAPVDPVATKNPNEKVWVMEDVPFGTRFPGLVTDKTRNAQLFIGSSLSPFAALFSSTDYSLSRWIEDDINGEVRPAAKADPMTPRADQQEDIKSIAKSLSAGSRGFFLTSQTGTGKTIVSVKAALDAARTKTSGARPANILVIANRPAAICIPDFRRTIQAVGDEGNRWLVTTVDRVHKVADLDVKWDVVIVDEAHGFRATDTRRSKSLAKVARVSATPKLAPFVIWMTATPAHDPTELTYLAPLLAQVLGEPAKDWSGKNGEFVESLARHGLHIPSGRYGKQWTEKPEERAEDVRLFRSWLTSGVPSTLYREAPWGQAPLDIATIELDVTRKQQYNSDWSEFQDELAAARSAGRGDKGRAAVLRWRQKALVLRIPEIVEWASAQLELDNQVVLYTDFVGVGANPITEALQDKKFGVARLFGKDYNVASELDAFYSGDSPVAVTTMSASINLQAGAVSQDGRKATMNQRVGAMTAPIYSGLKGRQVIGRTHRDGQVSPWVVMAADSTVEEKVSRVMIQRFAASDGLAGADTSALQQVAELIGADWLDLSTGKEDE
jgi:hypothetical protein